MRTTACISAPFSLLVVLAVLAAPLDGARAFDSTMFYAPPDPQPLPPLAIERRNAEKSLDVPTSAHQALAAHPHPPSGRICFTHEEARDRIAAFGLTEPFHALHLGEQQGEALRAKLCRWKTDEFVYEIAILRRDGRIVHVYMNAQNGKDVVP